MEGLQWFMWALAPINYKCIICVGHSFVLIPRSNWKYFQCCDLCWQNIKSYLFPVSFNHYNVARVSTKSIAMWLEQGHQGHFLKCFTQLWDKFYKVKCILIYIGNKNCHVENLDKLIILMLNTYLDEHLKILIRIYKWIMLTSSWLCGWLVWYQRTVRFPYIPDVVCGTW